MYKFLTFLEFTSSCPTNTFNYLGKLSNKIIVSFTISFTF